MTNTVDLPADVPPTMRQIRSLVTADARVRLSVETVETPVPTAHEVLVRVEAAPINPSDLGMLLPFADVEQAAALADLLDLPLAGELAPGVVDENDAAGLIQPTAPEVRRLLSQAPAEWCEHDQLLVDRVEVDWWVTGDGPEALVHAATTDGLALGLAWAAGRWELRGLVAGLLAEPETAADVMIDQVFSD